MRHTLFLLSCLLCASLPLTAEETDYLTFATEDEKNSTEIFSRASPSVVYVTNTALRRSLFSLNVQEIPGALAPDSSGMIVGSSSLIFM